MARTPPGAPDELIARCLARSDVATAFSAQIQDQTGLDGAEAAFATRVLLQALRARQNRETPAAAALLASLDPSHRHHAEHTRRTGLWLCLRIETHPARRAELAANLGISERPARAWQKLADEAREWIGDLSTLSGLELALGDSGLGLRLHGGTTSSLQAALPSRWLRPANAFVPLLGRETDLANLESVLGTDGLFHWVVVHGDGGVGKTRLAMEIVRDLARKGWDAGFLGPPDLRRLVSHPRFDRFTPVVPTLIVVRYAATQEAAIQSFLARSVADAEERRDLAGAPPLRLLLLERHASLQDGWLARLLGRRHVSANEPVARAFGGAHRLAVPSHPDPDQVMLRILDAATGHWAALAMASAPPRPAWSEHLRTQLIPVTGRRPLLVQLAALRACELGCDPPTWTRADVIGAAVARERAHLRSHCPDPALGDAVERGAALLCLCGAQSLAHPTWRAVLTDDVVRLGLDADRAGDVQTCLLAALGRAPLSDPPAPSPITPTVIGSSVATEVLAESLQSGRDAVASLLEHYALDTWPRLLRAAEDTDGTAAGATLHAWISDFITLRPREELIAVERLIPAGAPSLLTVRIGILARLVADLAHDPDDPERARLLNRYGHALLTHDRRHRALEATQEAVAIQTRLAAATPEEHEPDLASSLNNLGYMHSALLQREEALMATQRAVAIRERLADADPDAYEPDLAGSLNNLSYMHSALGQFTEALVASERAVALCERLAARDPDVYEPDLAMSLTNLSVDLNARGRCEDALVAAQRAVALQERLVGRDPDAFTSDLASSLNNLGNVHAMAGQVEPALAAIEQAVHLYEDLAALAPGTYAPDRATCLGALGSIHLRNQDPASAAEAFALGVSSLKTSFLRGPTSFIDLMRQLVSDYLAACHRGGLAEDEKLLASIRPLLEEAQDRASLS